MIERVWADEYREHRIEPSPGERITHDNTYGKARLDEVVLNGMNVHIEAMSKRNYVIILRDANGRELAMNARDVWIYEDDGFDDPANVEIRRQP